MPFAERHRRTVMARIWPVKRGRIVTEALPIASLLNELALHIPCRRAARRTAIGHTKALFRIDFFLINGPALTGS